MTERRQRLGRRGEDLAAEWYQHHGWTVLDRNWRCARGEIDLIVGRNPDGRRSRWREIAIVEVKARSSSRYGSGFDAVDPRKQARLRRLGARWLAEWAGSTRVVRFDVVEVDARGTLRVREGCF
ncbi:MAG: YraN family protein [Acidimicrobiales bacterium]